MRNTVAIESVYFAKIEFSIANAVTYGLRKLSGLLSAYFLQRYPGSKINMKT